MPQMTLQRLLTKYPHLREVGQEVPRQEAPLNKSMAAANAWENRGFRVLPDAAPFYYAFKESGYHPLYMSSQVYAVNSPGAAEKRQWFIDADLDGNSSWVERILQQEVSADYPRCADYRTVYRLRLTVHLHWKVQVVKAFKADDTLILTWKNQHRYELGVSSENVHAFGRYMRRYGWNWDDLPLCCERLVRSGDEKELLHNLFIDVERRKKLPH